MLEQRATHTPPVRRKSLPPQQQARPALQQQNRYAPPQYQRNMPTTNRPGAADLVEDEYDDVWPVRMSSSARRYQGLTTTDDEQIIQNGNKRIIIHHTPPPQSQPPPTTPAKQRPHFLFWLGCILCLMLVGWTIFSFLSGFIQTKRDDLLYQNPRIFQIDANVGHYGRVSHFVALNLHGYIEIFETQEGHPEVAKIYTPTALRISPSDPVILSFQDVTNNGKLDMIITAPSFQEVMFNNGTSFQSQPPGK